MISIPQHLRGVCIQRYPSTIEYRQESIRWKENLLKTRYGERVIDTVLNDAMESPYKVPTGYLAVPSAFPSIITKCGGRLEWNHSASGDKMDFYLRDVRSTLLNNESLVVFLERPFEDGALFTREQLKEIEYLLGCTLCSQGLGPVMVNGFDIWVTE